MGNNIAEFNQDILQCHLEIHKHLFDIIPINCKVVLKPNDETSVEFPAVVDVPLVGFSTKDKIIPDPSDPNYDPTDPKYLNGMLDATVTLENTSYADIYDNSNEIDCTVKYDNTKVVLDPNAFETTIHCTVKLDTTDNNTDFDGLVSIPFPYETPDDLYCTVNIDEEKYDHSSTDLNCKVTLDYDKIENTYLHSTEIDCEATVLKEFINPGEIDGTVNLDIDQCTADIDCTVTPLDIYHSTEWNCKIKVPSFHFIHSIPATINVVNGVCNDIYTHLQVMNKGLQSIDCICKLEPDNLSTDIDCTIDDIIPTAYSEFKCRARLDKFNTLKDLDCTVFNTITNNTEFDGSIEVKPAPITINKLDIDIPSTIETGYRNYKDIQSSLEVPEMHGINQDFLVSMKLMPKAKIGIIVAPFWHYEPFVFKSSLLTLFDKLYQKVSLHIVFGGNPRADWDIEHLGYVYKFNLEKVPIIFDRFHPDKTRESVEHFMQHLFSDKINKVFIFMDKPIMVKSSPLAQIAVYCEQNGIPLTVIDSSGEYFQPIENIKHDYDFKELDNYNHERIIHTQHHPIPVDMNNIKNHNNNNRPEPRIVL